MSKLLFTKPRPKVSIASVTDIVDIVSEKQGPLYFRGQENDAWGLQPTIARLRNHSHAGSRPEVAANPEEQEKALLHRFRRHTYEERNRVLDPWEVLFVARHHGLPVRLLDWTSNPLVALYFACLFSDTSDNDGAIWVLERRLGVPDIDVFTHADPMTIAGVRLIYPFYPTRKMTAQSGIFTIHAHPWTDLTTLKEGDPDAGDIAHGTKWMVPKRKKANMLRHLERLGINARTLFPDLSGIAEGLVHTEAFRIPSEYPSLSNAT